MACLANLILHAKSMSPQSLGSHSFRVTGGGTVGEVTTRNLANDTGGARGQGLAVISRSNMGLVSYALRTMAEQPRRLKFCLLGAAEEKWKSKRSTFNLLRDIKSGTRHVLNMHPWDGEKNVTWAEVERDVENFEMTELSACVTFLNTHGEDATAMFDAFEREVIDANYSRDEADIILGTPHAFKGLEFDRVQVLGEGFAKLDCVGEVQRDPAVALFDFK